MASSGSNGSSNSMRDLFSSLKNKASNRSLLLRNSAASTRSFSNFSDTSTGNDTQQASSPPLPETTHPFPVVEQPSRIILTSVDSPHFESQRLTSTRRGAVNVTSNRGDSEQFLLIPAAALDNDVSAEDGEASGDVGHNTKRFAKSKDAFYLRSYKHNRYLSSDSKTGAVCTIDFTNTKKKESDNNEEIQDQQSAVDKPGESEMWLLMCSPHGGHFIVSAKNELNIACIRGEESLRIGLRGENDKTESWEVEFVSGELCFLSSSNQTHIRCDLMGKLTLTTDKRGWEVWRFIEMGRGKVRIVSWMHNFCIACNHEGEVCTIGIGKADDGCCDEWTVEKAPSEFDGVVIKSVACARRILSRNGDENGGPGLATTQELDGANGVWQLDAAHSQTYTLTSVYHSKSIGPFPFVTDNVKQSDQLVLQQIDCLGTVRIYHKSLGGYLQSSVEGEISLCNEMPTPIDGCAVEEEEGQGLLWKMEQRSDLGGYTFTSKTCNGFLAFSTDGTDNVSPKICTIPSISEDEREIWAVNPILPRAISSSKIKTFALGTSIAVGTTVAMPFLMAGMLAVVPAEATLAASILSVGLTSAEAIASVGAIGATAAIVFREASDTLGIESEHDGEDGSEHEKDYTKRPLCSWRSW